jgi:hypothetical protein
MKNLTCLIYIMLILSATSCRKDEEEKDNNGIVISKSPAWSAKVTDDDSLAIKAFLQKYVVYQNKLVVKARKNKERILKMLDLSNGQTLWEWNDWIEKNVYDGNCHHYTKNNRLTFQTEYENYQIDLNNGKTVWKNSFQEGYGNWVQGIGEIFISDHLTNRNSLPEKGGGNIVVMSNLDGKPIYKFKPKYDTEKSSSENYGWFYSGYGVPFVKNGDTLIIIKFNDPSPTPFRYIEWLTLYNLTQKIWVYERQNLKDTDTNSGTPHPTIIYKDKVYHAGLDVVVCHDLMSGEKLWETKLPSWGQYFLFAGILVDNDKVYANSDGGQLFCLDHSSGKLLWQIRSSGTSTVLSYLNGVVYFVGGGDGKLHAVDAETGEYLWKIESPDLGKNKSAVFSGLCAVVPGVGSEKGKIVVTSGLNAYCYEAIR